MTTEISDLQQAYATLQLSPPITQARLKRRYKALVRRWHPDRYQSDPVRKAEATERLRNINLAYDLIASSLSSAPQSPAQYSQAATKENHSGTLSPEQVDAIVDSINRMNRVSLVPDMTTQHWLSLIVVVVYLIATVTLYPKSQRNRMAVMLLAYSCLPLTLIWTADREGRNSLERWCCRIFGWLFMAAPAILEIVFALMD